MAAKNRSGAAVEEEEEEEEEEENRASCGRFGEKGNEQTYESMFALAKALERSSSRSGMSRALRVAKQKAPSSALFVYFRYAGLELVWYKESGEN